jgi:conjugal transfer pilus assembly protein TraF
LKALPILFFSLLVLGNTALAKDALAPGQSVPYYQDCKRGWFWYEQKAPDKPGEETPKLQPEQKRRVPSLSDYTVEQLWDMYPDDFQALLIDFQKKAVWRPTPENVEEYYYVQDIARRKALAFTNVAGYVMQKDPELSVDKDYPTVIPGQNAMVRSREEEVRERITRAKGDHGLLFFYAPACEYCLEQEKIIQYFESQYGWEIKRIDFTKEKGTADMLGVTIVPTILLVRKGSAEAIPVSAGVISVAEMEEKIYRGVRLLAGEITPQEYSIYDFQKGGAFDVTKPAMKKGGRQ